MLTNVPGRIAGPMKEALKEGAGWLLRARQELTGIRSRPLLVLGHMRSGSTLLFHLLAAHPEIAGYGERNIPYRSPPDFQRLRVDVYYRCGGWWEEPTYVVDQINHERLSPSVDLVRETGARAVILVRRPGPAIGSMVEVLGAHYPDMNRARAVSHYTARLAGLTEVVESLGGGFRPFALTYSDLLERSERSLRGLTEYLELESPLDETYPVRNETGSRGDPSDVIRAGRIVREKPEHEVHLDERTAKDLATRFERTLEVVRRRALTPDSFEETGEP